MNEDRRLLSAKLRQIALEAFNDYRKKNPRAFPLIDRRKKKDVKK